MNYSTNKVNNSKEDIELIKTAIETGTCTLAPVDDTQDSEFMIKIYDKPPFEKGSKVTMTYVYNVFRNIPLAVVGAACKDVVDIVINNGIGYRAYLRDIAKNNAMLMYFTNFPANEFTFEEINGLCTSEFNYNIMRDVFVDVGMSDFYNDFEVMVRSQIDYEKKMSVHKSELTKLIDSVIITSSDMEVNREELAQTVKEAFTNAISEKFNTVKIE